MSLPMHAHEITTEWLTEALSSWTPGVKVQSIDEMHVQPGTATKIRLRLRYAENVPDGPPEALCLKGGFDGGAWSEIIGIAYQLEANFYAHAAAQLGELLPKCWYAAAEPERGQGIIILEDLVVAGARFGSPLEPWPVSRVAAAVEMQAAWHAVTWAATPEAYPWLPVGTPVRGMADYLLGESHWETCLADESLKAVIPVELQDRVRVRKATFAVWELDRAHGIPCLSHGDPHLGNTYVDAQGNPHFLDWQVASLSPGIDDLSYFIGGSLTVEDRRANEQHLLKHYLDVLAAHGGPKTSFDAAWLDYRRHSMHGLLWAMTAPTAQPIDYIVAMTQRHAAAIVDHGTLDLLGC